MEITAASLDPNHCIETSLWRVLQVGDWGRDGQHNQSRVAGLMGKVADSPQFIISVGDNFYETGLTSVEDPQFDTSFTQVYTDPSLQVS